MVKFCPSAQRCDYDRPSALRPFALVLVGAVSRLALPDTSQGGSPVAQGQASELYKDQNPFIPLRITKAALTRHIFEPNGGRAQWDCFVHSWHPELRMDFAALYHPLAAASFDDNRRYEREFSHARTRSSPWSQLSFGLSISLGLKLLQEYILRSRRGEPYDRIVVCRPDVFLGQDLNLSSPAFRKRERMYLVNRHPHRGGDFHFILDGDNASIWAFSQLPHAALALKLPLEHHVWIRLMLERMLPGIVANYDNVYPGRDEECYRKLLMTALHCWVGQPGISDWYNMTSLDWANLRAVTPLFGRPNLHYHNCSAQELSRSATRAAALLQTRG
eukprot:4743395-Prymnesium_polylepis.1